VAEGRLNSKGRAVASGRKPGAGVATVPIFLLVPQVKLRKRLDLARDAERAVDGVPGLIVAKWVERSMHKRPRHRRWDGSRPRRWLWPGTVPRWPT
jgi:hypothetical protein